MTVVVDTEEQIAAMAKAAESKQLRYADLIA